jgi:tRNA modification GTPase
LGRWGGPAGEELIVCRQTAEQVEVHCHGGVAAVDAVIEQLERAGCRRLTWQEWVRAAEVDPIRAAARIALAAAPTARTAAILLDQYRGALRTVIQQAAAAVQDGNWRQAAAVLDGVLEFRGLGRHLTRPWQVVLAGPPNVGKSSLINSLAGYERAIVSHVPGTTRDVVTTTTAIAGWPVELADTAGRRAAADELEAAGIALADAAVAQADLVVLVTDATDANAAGASRREIGCPMGTARLLVRNKIDLLPRPHHAAQATGTIATSAVTGEGIADLVAAIGRALVPNPPAVGTAVPFMEEQVAALEAAGVAVQRRNALAAAAALQALLAD